MRSGAALEAAILRHPLLPVVGVSIGMERECQQMGNLSMVFFVACCCNDGFESRRQAGAALRVALAPTVRRCLCPAVPLLSCLRHCLSLRTSRLPDVQDYG